MKNAQFSQEALVLSHMGFYVRDLNLMSNFYQDVLDFTVTDQGDLGSMQIVFLSRDPTEHHQIILASGRPEDLGFGLINQISFKVPDLNFLRIFHQKAKEHALVTDLVSITHGNAVSIYFRDPELNRIEIFMDSPWYCEQPLRVEIDLQQSDEEILKIVKDLAMSRPNFSSRQDWLEKTKSKMGY
ncbi:MAG: VOC family protein [Betaproteobacteria bacterium]|jgi:catechol-2,3-dioxygenase